jgi:branched-chain amino acid transport system ATP-binding protein
MEATSFFDIRHLSISFGGIKAIQDIGFAMKKGEIFSVIGPNGAGKTTLFNCISGLYKPDRGEIVFKGDRIQGKRPDAVARMGIARTFQNIELFSHMNTMENIMSGRHIHMKTGLFSGLFMRGRRSFAGKEEIRHRESVEKIIDFLDLQGVRDKLVGGLPYGTQKQIELARALALEPELLLLDEPCAGMNSEEKQDMIFWIKDIQDELSISILLIEHDMKMVMDISDRVLAINFGQTVTLGTPRQVQQNPDVLKAYIGEENG